MAALARRLGKVAPQGRFSGVSRMVVVMLEFRVKSTGITHTERLSAITWYFTIYWNTLRKQGRVNF